MDYFSYSSRSSFNGGNRMGVENNDKIREYIDDVCSQIKFHEIHNDIGLELESHIRELSEEYIAEELTEDEAVEKAITQMGDAFDVGKKLNRIHKPKPDWRLVILTLIFTGVGLLSLYFIVNSSAREISSLYFTKSLIFNLTGLIIALGLYFFDYRKIQPLSKYIYVVTLLFLLFTCKTRGISLHGITFNFAQISTVLFAIALPGIFEDWNWQEPKKLLYSLLMYAAPVFLMMVYPSVVSAFIYSVMFMTIAVASGFKLKYMLMLVGSGIVILILDAFRWPLYKIERFTAFLDPKRDPLGSGYINSMLYKIVHSAGFWGQGPSANPMKVIPDIHTDFMFAYIIYTFGWAAGVILVTLIAVFLLRITHTAKNIKNDYGKLMMISFTTVFAVQFILHILMILGLIPIMGVSLPFISYGGSQSIMNMVMVGLILSIYRRRNIVSNLQTNKI